MKEMMNRYRDILKEKKKVQKQTDLILEGLQSAKESKAKADVQSEKLQARILKKREKLEDTKAKREARKDFWSRMGLEIIPMEGASLGKTAANELLGGDCHEVNPASIESRPNVPEGKFDFVYTKLDPQNLHRKFTVSVSFTPEVKIYGADPADFFHHEECTEIEKKASTTTFPVITNNNVMKESNQDPTADVRLLAILLRHHIQSKFKN
jgi:hypothetical protein